MRGGVAGAGAAGTGAGAALEGRRRPGHAGTAPGKTQEHGLRFVGIRTRERDAVGVGEREQLGGKGIVVRDAARLAARAQADDAVAHRAVRLHLLHRATDAGVQSVVGTHVVFVGLREALRTMIDGAVQQCAFRIVLRRRIVANLQRTVEIPCLQDQILGARPLLADQIAGEHAGG